MSRPDGQKSLLQDAGGLVLTRAIGLLPHRAALALGAGAGRLICALAPKKRRRIEGNLRRTECPHPRKASWRAGAQIGRTMAEMAWLLWRTPEEIDATTEVDGLDVMKAAVARGKGVLLVGGHVGNWELGVRGAARCGTPVFAVARRLGSPRVESAIAHFRESGGVHTLTRGARGASVAAYRTLRNGHILACMMDRMSSGRRIAVPFLGAHIRIPVGPIVLARRAGAAIIVGGARRRRDGSTYVRLYELPPAPDGADETEDDVARRVAAELDAFVTATPEQWYWIYRRPAKPKHAKEQSAAAAAAADVPPARVPSSDARPLPGRP